jgi:LysR family carnitine catabolism transcriptional activator
MKSINFSVRDIEAFMALAQARHFTRAAERCHLSQSAFSQRIQRIEDTAGLKLFERSTRHVTLTPEGQVFADDVGRIEQDLRTALSNLQDLAARRVGRVAVAALPSVAAVWMPPAIAQYSHQFPQIDIQLFDTLATTGLALLREGKVDFAITAGGDLREFDTRVLCDERYWLVCRKDHSLGTQTGVSLKQLTGQKMINMARSSSVRQHLIPVTAVDDLPTSTLEVEHLATLAALIAQGLGISIVPELTLFHFERAGLHTCPVEDKTLHRPVVLAQRKGEALSVAAQAMVALVLAQAENEAAVGDSEFLNEGG